MDAESPNPPDRTARKIKNMAKTILATDQTESQILNENWYGEFQLHCRVYASDEVFLQANDPDDPDTDWITASFNGVDIKFSKVGSVFDVKLARDIHYRLYTANAGAKVVIAKHDVHG